MILPFLPPSFLPMQHTSHPGPVSDNPPLSPLPTMNSAAGALQPGGDLRAGACRVGAVDKLLPVLLAAVRAQHLRGRELPLQRLLAGRVGGERPGQAAAARHPGELREAEGSDRQLRHAPWAEELIARILYMIAASADDDDDNDNDEDDVDVVVVAVLFLLI